MTRPAATREPWWGRAYGIAVRAFPLEFRERWERDMRLAFADRVRGAGAADRTPWRLIARELGNVVAAGFRERLHSSHRPSDMVHAQDIRYAFRLLAAEPRLRAADGSRARRRARAEHVHVLVPVHGDDPSAPVRRGRADRPPDAVRGGAAGPGRCRGRRDAARLRADVARGRRLLAARGHGRARRRSPGARRHGCRSGAVLGGADARALRTRASAIRRGARRGAGDRAHASHVAGRIRRRSFGARHAHRHQRCEHARGRRHAGGIRFSRGTGCVAAAAGERHDVDESRGGLPLRVRAARARCDARAGGSRGDRTPQGRARGA